MIKLSDQTNDLNAVHDNKANPLKLSAELK